MGSHVPLSGPLWGVWAVLGIYVGGLEPRWVPMLTVLDLLGPLLAILGRSLGLWCRFGVLLAPLGGILEGSCSNLGAPWRVLKPSWVAMGRLRLF